MTITRTFGIVAMLALVSVACSEGGSTGAASPSNNDTPSSSSLPDAGDTVTIEGFLYKPADITVPVGTQVTWTNQDEILHTVTEGTPEAPGTGFDGQLEDRGSTFMQTFDEAGTYSYFCTRHNHMQGTVTVS